MTTSRLRIDLGALAANFRLFCDAARPGISGAVVKADAYGLGAGPVARTLWAEGCRDFFVATLEEGDALRRELPDVRIFVFEGAAEQTAPELAAAGLTPVLNHAGQLDAWRRAGQGAPAAVHVDTGMHRLGFPPGITAAHCHGVPVTLLMTHLACADEPDDPFNDVQLERLARVRPSFPGVPVSIGNSAGMLWGAARCGDVGRPGIGLYGGNPYRSGTSLVRPVAALEGRVLQVRDVAAGDTVGYGATFTASRPLTVAVVGLGYGDGLPRLLSNRGQAWLDGSRCPIVGRVSMDLTAVDVSGLRVSPGDWVEFLGANVTVDEVARWAETIPYEVLTGLGRRPGREYLSS